MLVINPDECIDCNLCVSECPVDAIYPDDEVPEDQKDFIEINEKYSQEWPVLGEKIDPPADADKWATIQNKRQEFKADISKKD